MRELQRNSSGDAFVHHAPEVLRFLKKQVGGNEASDLAQEAFERVLRYAKRSEIIDARSLLHVTAANLVKDHIRRKRIENKYLLRGIELDALLCPSASPAARLDVGQSMVRLSEALEKLPPRPRQVFKMWRFDALSPSEIAGRLGVTRNMVEKHLRTARARLAKAL